MANNPQRRWCFTIMTNYEGITSDEREVHYWNPDEEAIRANDKIRYVVLQKEVCPTTNALHWQGYIELRQPQRMTWVKNALNCGWAHLEISRGTAEQARAYCMKEESRAPDCQPIEIGTWIGGQGKRTDISACVEDIKSGKTMSELIDTHADVLMKYPAGFNLIRSTVQAQASLQMRPDLRVTVLVGPPGVGKTRYVYDRHGLESVFTLTQHSGDRLWWNSYDNHQVLLIDDFYGWIRWGELLKILDIYPLRLETKGSFTWASFQHVYITSNTPWNQWYQKNHPLETQGALKRRIHTVMSFGPSGSEPPFTEMTPEAATVVDAAAFAPGFHPAN